MRTFPSYKLLSVLSIAGCIVVYFALIQTSFFNTQAPSELSTPTTTTHPPKQQYEKTINPPYPWMDAVLPIAKPNCIAKTSLSRLIKFYEFRRIYYIANEIEDCPELESWDQRVKCVARDDLIPGITISNISETSPMPKRAGWYFQQILKLAVADAIPELSDYYLITDSDLIPLQPFPLFSSLNDTNEHPRIKFYTGPYHGNGHPYDTAYKLLTGYAPIHPSPDGWVCGHQTFFKPFVRELLARITEKHQELYSDSKLTWPLIIMNVTNRPERAKDPFTAFVGFSEYDSYGSWVARFHADSQDIVSYNKRIWIREVQKCRQKNVELCCPTEATLSDISKGGTLWAVYELQKYNTQFG